MTGQTVIVRQCSSKQTAAFCPAVWGTIKSNGLSGDSLTGKAYREDATPQGLAFANGGISKLISGQSAAVVSVWVKFDAVHDLPKRENIMIVHINGVYRWL